MQQVRDDWVALYLQAKHATPYQSWDWCDAWHRNLKEPLWILVARDMRTQRVVGIFPLSIKHGSRFPFRTLVFVGDAAANICSVLIAPGCEQVVFSAFFEHLDRNKKRWDLAELFFIHHVPAQLAQPMQPSLRVHLAPCRVCLKKTLPTSWNALLGELSANVRSNVKRRRRQLEQAFDSVVFEQVGGVDVAPTLQALFEMNQTRWQQRGRRSFFANQRVQLFEKEVAQAFEKEGVLRLYRIQINGVTRAVLYCLRIGDTFDFRNTAFDLSMSNFSLGLVLLGYAMEEAIRQKCQFFDFGRGNLTYKYMWKPNEYLSYRITLGHDSVRSKMSFLFARTHSYLEEKNVGIYLVNSLWGQKSIPARLRERLLRAKKHWFGAANRSATGLFA